LPPPAGGPRLWLLRMKPDRIAPTLTAWKKNRLRVVLSQQPRGRSLYHRRSADTNRIACYGLTGYAIPLEPGKVRFGPSGLLGKRGSPLAAVSPGSRPIPTERIEVGSSPSARTVESTHSAVGVVFTLPPHPLISHRSLRWVTISAYFRRLTAPW
jgi:hypothetical protein